ncbi:MAG: PQQ-dependent sugar dehydrogenase [Planctomycetaceae bacterium]
MRALRPLPLVAACLFVSAAVAAEPKLTDAEKHAGWRLIFDGKTTSGWRNFKKDAIGSGWSVKDGALTRTGDGAGNIVSQEEFDNFELSIEYKIVPEGNSGLGFHVTEDGNDPWYIGPEVQIQDNVKGHDPQKSGWLYGLYKPGMDPATGETIDATRPAGEWNHVQLRVTKEGCEINMNGIRYAQFKIGDADWNRRVAASKFAKSALFGKSGKGHIVLQDHGHEVAYRNIKVRVLPPDGAAPNPVTGKLALKPQLAFMNLEWAGWEPVNERGLATAFRPVALTHAGDGSNRIFVGDEWGVVYAFENRPDVTESKVFLDLRDRVKYTDNENEEGLLGLAFHPKYKENGEFFVYYSTRAAEHTTVVSRFKVSRTDPNRADPGSEEELLRIPAPFWNHKGGTICFGPDGCLYVGMGDGGAANDPYGNGQNLETWLGKILRVDVDHRANGKTYAIPGDNPFASTANKALPEIYAYGFRNIWRMAFDRATGALWIADVGQNLWEEIDIGKAGGNYGWAVREGTHPFGSKGSDASPDLIEPIWEYDHQVGKSITGGIVYRGKQHPELVGKYIYADFVSGKIWALKYDEAAGKVVSNEEIPSEPGTAIINISDDEQGELYFTVVSSTGKGIYTIVAE